MERAAPGGRSRVGWAGAAVAALYVIVAFATAELSSRPVLPLFDGIAPPTPYAWVNPPPERAADNVAPHSVERELPLGPGGSEAANVTTDDAQAIVGLDDGSVPPNPPDTALTVRIIPVDAGTLGPLPAGLRVVSNAYEVSLAYVPSGAAVSELAVPGTIALTAAETGNRLLYLGDGQTWEELPFRPYGNDHGLFTEMNRLGWFVVASAPTGRPSGDGRSDALRWVVLTVAAVAPIIGAILVVRLPSPVPATPVRPRSGASQAKKGRKKTTKRKQSGKRRR